MRTRLPEDLRVPARLVKGATWADLVAKGIAQAAVKGKADCAREIADRIEGRVPQPVNVETTSGGLSALETAQRIKDLYGI